MGRPLAGAGAARGKSCRRCAFCWATPLLLILTTASGLGAVWIRHLIEAGIRDAAVVDRPGTSGYGRFSDSYTYFVVTFFNITNADEILESGSNPRLVEVGPFVYRMYQSRKDVQFDAENDTVSYRQHTWTEFDRDETVKRSNGVHHDDTRLKVTTLNLLFSGMRTQASEAFLHTFGGMLWKGDRERLFEERTPRELLEGYNVTFKIMGLSMRTVPFPGIAPNLAAAKDPNMLHRSAIRIGARDNTMTFSYRSWEGQSEARVACPYGAFHLPFSSGCKATQKPCCGQKELVPLWDTSPAPGEFDADANLVQGATGEQFRRGLYGEREELDFYFGLVRRTMRLVTTPGERKEHEGVPVRTFRPEYNTFWANAIERPANARYYQWGPSGLLNMTMSLGADLYMSPAHFLGCDPSLLEAVDGLRPDPAKHGFEMGVEPETGITLQAHSTVMLSGRVQAEKTVPGTRRGWFPALADRTLYVPIAWFSLEIPKLPQEALNALSYMRMGYRFERLLRWTCAVGTAALMAVLALRLVYCLRG